MTYKMAKTKQRLHCKEVSCLFHSKKKTLGFSLCALLNVKGVDRWVAGYWFCLVAQVSLDLRETATVTFNLIYS